MKKSYGLPCIFLVLAAVSAFAQDFTDIQQHGTCKYCNMDRQQYAHSRMLVIYKDGTEFGACSLHCVAVDLALNIDKTPQSILAADYNTKQLIEAETAYWILGGTLHGVMTKRAKWCFAKERHARRFMHRNGGSLVTFDEALKATYEDMYADSKMIRNKRKLRKMHAQ
ncbi:nitrous oxide reductase accessory protein NosL [Desulfoferrobacter suflitae]|uniref:nitrous oxide reductase accessory protein NosL n=1 Tax=Desulfoferrobacter suflitae TaxID=2865782 RepID=UPI0021640884|nr:nitrous oxide reductase accessory protein NosL [Desulfoferrobacter suflitae]MCK8600962.1 nitrous oxide reductase accessory protein NosL [Desulfoferrobacter suflitae]